MRLLICEDQEIVLKTLIYKLQLEGFTTKGAKNGKEAIELLIDNDYDLIISDILMPYHSGLEILNFIRNDLQLDTPFIFLSKTGSEDTIKLAKEMDANHFMFKPFDPNELVKIITKLIYNEKEVANV